MRTTARLAMREGWLAAAALAGFAVVALAARAGPATPATAPAAAPPSGPREPTVSARPQSDRLADVTPSGRSHFRLPWTVIELVLLLILLLAAAGLAVVLWPKLKDRWRSRHRPRPGRAFEPAPDDLIRQVSGTLRATMSQVSGGQIRDAVILCWHRLEQTAEAAGLRRSPADTSSDLAGRLLASMPLSEAPLYRLAELYREARFSSHPIPAEAVAQARADLAQLRAELEAAAQPAEARHG